MYIINLKIKKQGAPKMTENTKIRQFIDSDETDVITVFNEVFNDENPDYIPMTRNLRNWKYNRRPEPSEILVITDNNNNVVGQMGTQVDRIIYDGQNRLVYVIIDLCAKKGFRGQNTIKRFFASLSKVDQLKWGFPGSEYWKVYPRIDPSNQCFRLKIFNKKLKTTSDTPNTVILTETLSAKDQINQLWQSKQSEIKIGTIRDWDYLKWAIIDCPVKTRLFLISINNKVIGYVAIRIENGICYIVDILIINNYLNRATISAIEYKCLLLGGNEIQLFITDEKVQTALINQDFIAFDENQLTQNGYFNFIDLENKHRLISDFYLTWVNADWYLYDKINS